MAETNTRKKTASTPQKKSGSAASARKQSVTSATAASGKPAGSKSKKPAKSAATKKTTAAAKKTPPKKAPRKNQKDPRQVAAETPRRSTFAEQYMSYILIAIGLFLAVCFILNAVVDAKTAADHPMGPVGYYICHFLFGCFGWTGYLIPLVLLNLAIFWRQYWQERLLPIKIILSVILMVLISAVIHVGVCASNKAMAQVYDVAYLYRTGSAFESGGVVGGLVGYALNLGLRLPGTIVLAVVTLPLVVMCLVGVTPASVFSKLRASYKKSREQAAEDRAIREEEKAAREEEKSAREAERRKESAEESYRARRARLAAEAEAEAAKKADTSKKNETPKKADQPMADPHTAEHRKASLDLETGEIIEEDIPVAEPAPAESKKLRKRGTPAPVAADEAQLEIEIEEEEAPLPLYEPPVPKEEIPEAPQEAPAPSPEAYPSEDDDDDLDWDKDYYDPNSLLEEEDRYNGEADTMDVDFADDLPPEEEAPSSPSADTVTLTASETVAALSVPVKEEDPASETAPAETVFADTAPAQDPAGGHYEVVTAAEEDPIAAKPVDTLTVRILKQETAAVAEAGLSEEEVVISTAHTAEELPAEPPREYVFPPVDLLTKGSSRYEANDAEIAENTRTLREVLESFHIGVKEISCSCGPTITRFEVKPESGVRVRSIANLVDDIAMGLAKAGVRIEAPIPGKPAVGIEVPNAEPATVYFRNILETPEFRNHKSRIAACLGADVSGRPVILDINKMPHLLVAGTTGSGKSVCINSIIMSILYKAKPDEVKLILIDPKKVEFAVYRDLPHLYCPLISDPKKAAGALNSAVNEMERRFGLIEEVGVRNVAGYNEVTAGDPERPPLPQMVIIIDELADLMMTASNEVETAICRLAQKARAAGIHLILGTQRPSTDVITGLIKANIPSRIAFTVTQQIDSRIIIDSVGAEKLIGRGDMLYSPVGTTKPMRVQGTFVSDGEVERVVTFIKEHNEKGVFDESFTRQIEIEAAKCGMGKKKGEQMSIDDFDGLGGDRKDSEDPKFWEALDVAAGKDKIGTSALQRALNLGYGRAAKIIDRMEELGFVGPDPGTKQGRKVYITKQDLIEYKINGLPGSSEEDEDGDGEL